MAKSQVDGTLNMRKKRTIRLGLVCLLVCMTVMNYQTGAACASDASQQALSSQKADGVANEAGIVFVISPWASIVRMVNANSPAQRAGIIAGDKILSVYGKSTSEMPFKNLGASLRGSAGANIPLTILRAGKVYSSALIFPGFNSRADLSKEITRKEPVFATNTDTTFAHPEYILASSPTSDTAAVKATLAPVLRTIPATIRDAVFEDGCRIMVVPTVSGYMATGYSDKPRGYTDGGGYDNADGLFVPAHNQLLISEKVSYRNSAPGKSYRIPYVVRHEFGHAYDYYLAHRFARGHAATALTKFTETHSKEVLGLTNSARSNLAYFCQPGADGASETFAELFCMHCESPSEWSDQQHSLLGSFPLSDELVKQAMSSPETVMQW